MVNGFMEPISYSHGADLGRSYALVWCFQVCWLFFSFFGRFSTWSMRSTATRWTFLMRIPGLFTVIWRPTRLVRFLSPSSWACNSMKRDLLLGGFSCFSYTLGGGVLLAIVSSQT